jgi:CubicO group peptidase (beta-lactamase class C family)
MLRPWRAALTGFALLVFLLTACAPNVPPVGPATSRFVYPGARWEAIGEPSSVGYCRDRLEVVAARVKTLPTTGMMVVVGGRVLFQHGDVDAVSYLASVRKSVLAMLFGNYVASGTIDLGKTLAQLKIDDLGGLTESEKAATIADLLAARSGVYHRASNPGDNLADAPPRGSQQHGTYFLYSNWDFNTLGTIFEQETGQSIYDALARDLASPIGMQDFDRSTHERSGDVTRSIHLAYHMNLSTRDMARVGYVMLREGTWGGRQVVPRDWVRRIVTPVTHVDQMNPPNIRKGPFGYGYLWWVWDRQWNTGPYSSAYTGMGALGQFITVLPKLDMVIAHKTRPGGASVSASQYLELLERVIDARCSSTSSL